jgi:hypothetical protein
MPAPALSSLLSLRQEEIVTTPDEQTMRQLPTAVLYDVFRDTATALSTQYVARSDQAATGDLTEQWWQRALQLRDDADAVDPDDRGALIEHIVVWRQQTADLASE